MGQKEKCLSLLWLPILSFMDDLKPTNGLDIPEKTNSVNSYASGDDEYQNQSLQIIRYVIDKMALTAAHDHNTKAGVAETNQ